MVADRRCGFGLKHLREELWLGNDGDESGPDGQVGPSDHSLLVLGPLLGMARVALVPFHFSLVLGSVMRHTHEDFSASGRRALGLPLRLYAQHAS